MNAPPQPPLPAIGAPMPGGFFAGAIHLNGQRFAIILAPKKHGELAGARHKDEPDVPGAKSHNDGLANTQVMSEAGSAIAKQVRDLSIDGLSDYYIPAQDELEIIYRNLKPTTDRNSQYGRSGINVSAIPPSHPYTPTLPAQTCAKAFQSGGTEAFDPDWYWSSTQHAGFSSYAWCQGFSNGDQSGCIKYGKLRVRAVRRVAIE